MSLVVRNMLFTNADNILIKNLFELKGYNAKHLVIEFPSIGWNLGSVYKLLQELWVIGSVYCHSGSGSWCSTHTADNTNLVNKLLLHKNV